MISLAAVALAVIVLFVLWNRHSAADSGINPVVGTATINSRPEGLAVTIDDQNRGSTPLKLSLPLGDHVLRIQAGSEARTIPLIIEAGTSASHYIDFGTAATGPITGRLEVTSQPSGFGVRVDGVAAGVTPLTLPTLAAGNHQIVVGSGDTAVTRSVTILPGAASSIVASFGEPSSRAGWVSFKTPFEMQVLEGGRLIGTTGMDRVMLPSGAHQLELLNEPLAFRTTMPVRVVPGKTVTPTVTVPSGSLSVNASPWADVTIDGRPAGTTPLANITLPIGSHDIVFTRPEQGQRRRTAVITARSPARIAVDFNSPE